MKGRTHNLHPDLTTYLLELEERMGFELTITSGYRDPAHNQDVGGVSNSEHTYDQAHGVDILCKQSTTRYKMIGALYDMGIKRMGIGKDFVHVGIAKDKPQKVLWHYYPAKKGAA